MKEAKRKSVALPALVFHPDIHTENPNNQVIKYFHLVLKTKAVHTYGTKSEDGATINYVPPMYKVNTR